MEPSPSRRSPETAVTHDCAVGAVPRLVAAAAARIAAGELNGRTVADLAADLGVSERQLRRVLERELGVSPIALAQTHRLLMAKRLLTDTPLPVTRIAYASGYQSLRRFNAAFRAHYRISPAALRRDPASAADGPPRALTLTLSYRPPFAWEALLASLAAEAIPGVESADGSSYSRAVSLGGHEGWLVARHALQSRHVLVEVPAALVDQLIPLLARARRLFDLDAVPALIDRHLAAHGLAGEVSAVPGLRVAGAFCGFESAVRALVGPEAAGAMAVIAGPVVDGAPPGVKRALPPPSRIAVMEPDELGALGVQHSRAAALTAVAAMAADGRLCLEPCGDPRATTLALTAGCGVEPSIADLIVARALRSPDALPFPLPGVPAAVVDGWRPWRAYGAAHIRLRCAARAATSAQ